MARDARLTRTIRSLRARVNQRGGSGTVAKTGEVTAVSAGASLDGKAEVTVTVDGNDLLCTWNTWGATPVVGDQALVLLLNGSPHVVGAVGGFPNI
jgi:hypothetical protein